MLTRTTIGPQRRFAVTKFDRVLDLSYIFLARQQRYGSIRQLPLGVITLERLSCLSSSARRSRISALTAEGTQSWVFLEDHST
jgi:hypothetical protein